MQIEIVQDTLAVKDWDHFVDEHPHAGPMQYAGWHTVLSKCFGVQLCYLRAVGSAGSTIGILPLYLSQSLLFGHHLTSLEGGALAVNEKVAGCLYEKALDIMQDADADYLLVRGGKVGIPDGAVVQETIHTLVDLQGGSDAVWKRISRNTRNQIRKGRKNGFIAKPLKRFSSDYYPIYTHNLHVLGTPTPGLRFLQAIEKYLANYVCFVGVFMDGVLVGGKVLIRNRRSWHSILGAVRRDVAKLYPNYVLYWSAIQDACENGVEVYDMGRSVPNSGTHRFKQKLGKDRVIPYHYFPNAGRTRIPSRPAAARSFKQAIWSRLPLALANRLGPILRRQLPFG